MGMDTSVRVAHSMTRGRKGRGPRGAIGDTDSRSTSGPDPVAGDIRIVTSTDNATARRCDSSVELEDMGPADKSKKPSYWRTVPLAEAEALRRGCEIPQIIIKTLAKGVFVALADLTPAALSAAASGGKPIHVHRRVLDSDVFETELAGSGVESDVWQRDSTLNKGDWQDAYKNLLKALALPLVDMPSHIRKYFTDQHNYIIDHEYASNGSDWSIMAKADLQARLAFFAQPRRSFDTKAFENLVARRYLESLTLRRAVASEDFNMHSQPVASNSRVRRLASLAEAPPVGLPFRKSTHGTAISRCWICKASHKAAECHATGKYSRFAVDLRATVRASDGKVFCGPFNSRPGCHRTQCDKLHECTVCGSSAHGASQAVC